MYKAKNGLILKDSKTPAGFNIRSDADIITALLYFPTFQTVATGFIEDALNQAKTDRSEYADIKDLAQHLLTYYI